MTSTRASRAARRRALRVIRDRRTRRRRPQGDAARRRPDWLPSGRIVPLLS